MPGRLSVVATPIGNLEDITYRAVRVLSEAHWIACEDTRITRRLLERYNIRTPTLSYHEHNEAERTPELLERLQTEHGALVSDAGTPLISDPGYRLIRGAIDAGITVEAIPGPSALIAALSIAGLPVHEFHFGGFLPPKQGARLRALEDLRHERGTLIFYEAPHRVLETLRDIEQALGAREVAAARELTKVHEEIVRGTPAEVAESLVARDAIRGEFVLLVAPGKAADEQTAPDEAVLALIDAGVDRMEAMKTVARERGLSKREVYRLLSVKK